MTEPKVLAIILNYRTPEMTLKSAAAARREMRDIAGEVLIVDNGSDDGSDETIAQHVQAEGWEADGSVRVLQSGHNGGFGAGMNFGIRAGLSDGQRPDFIYLLNSDAWPEPGAIRHLLDHLADTPGTGIAGGFIQGEDGEPHRTAFRFPSVAGEFEAAARTGVFSRLLSDAIVAIPVPEQDTRIDWCAGASMMLRMDMLDEIGLFDETFFLYYEETDLCRRAAAAGWETWYLPGSAVVHVGSASTGMKTWRRKPDYWFDSRTHYFVKNHGQAYWILATLAMISGGLIWRLRRLVSNKPKADPDWLLWDLTRHSIRAIIGGKPKPVPLPGPAAPIVEDSK